MRRARTAAVLGLALLLGGCVYFNSMYNTKRLASSARKAERDGRTFEANNLWGQVITRAESLVARHPDSKYVDEALVLKGLALSRLKQCQSAVAPLGRVSLLPADAEVTEEASLALGRCQLELGDPAVAVGLFARIAGSEDPARRAEARLLQGRALRLSGRGDEAVAALEGLPGLRAGTERVLALASARKHDAALALADSLLAQPDTTVRWDSLTAVIGSAAPLTASGLVDRLIERPGTVPQTRAMLLLDDGLRLAAVDTARSRGRLEEAVKAEGTGAYAERARLALTRRRLASIASPEELRALANELDQRISAAGTAAAEAGTLREQVTLVLAAVDSAAAGGAQADLRLFFAAEAARDSLASPRLAASLFRTIAEGMPESPYAPKAVLAGMVLDPEWGESAVVLLEERYALSPYVALVRGEEPYGYRELEDSLQAFARGLDLPASAADGRDSLPTQPGPGGVPRRRRLEP